MSQFFSSKERREEKRIARKEEEQALQSGAISPEELHKQNYMFYGVKVIVDFSPRRKAT